MTITSFTTGTPSTTVDVRVKREPLTYAYGNGQSFFADLMRAHYGQQPAKERLARHETEMAVELRTNPNGTLGTGGEFTPPLWAINQFATAPRAGRVLADLVPRLLLPAGVSAVHAPKITTGADTGVQSAQGVPGAEVDQITADAGAANDVVTIAGNVDASLQLLDQTPDPGYDAIVNLDLHRAYNEDLELQMLNGLGTNGQLTGIQRLTGRVADVSGSSVSATQATGVPQFWPLLGQAAAALANTRKAPPEVFLMAPRRWYWTAFLTVAIGNTAQQSPYPSLPLEEAFILNAGMPYQAGGVPVYLDGAITAGTSADVAITCRPSDMLLYESTEKFAVNPDPMSGTLQVKLQLRRYVAFLVMKASSVCVVIALPAPTSYGA